MGVISFFVVEKTEVASVCVCIVYVCVTNESCR